MGACSRNSCTDTSVRIPSRWRALPHLANQFRASTLPRIESVMSTRLVVLDHNLLGMQAFSVPYIVCGCQFRTCDPCQVETHQRKSSPNRRCRQQKGNKEVRNLLSGRKTDVRASFNSAFQIGLAGNPVGLEIRGACCNPRVQIAVERRFTKNPTTGSS